MFDYADSKSGAATEVDSSPALERAPKRAAASEQAKGAPAPAKDDKAEKERVARIKAKWEDSLGKFLGGKLFDLIKEHVSMAGLEGYAKQGIASLGKEIPGLWKPTEAGAAGGLMDEASEAEAMQKLTAALMPELMKAAEGWLAGSDGQKVLKAISGWVEGHPRAIAASLGVAVIGAAVAAYLSDMEIPELEKMFNLGGGWSAGGSASLGSLQNIAIQAATATVAWKGKGLNASLSGSWDAEGGASATVAAGLQREIGEGKSVNANGSFTFDESGKGTLSLDGGLKTAVDGTPLSVAAGIKHSDGGGGEATTTVNGQLVLGEKNQQTTVKGTWDPSSDKFSLSLGQHLVQDLGKDGKLTYDSEMGTDGAKTSIGWSKNDVSAQLDLAMKEGASTLGLQTAYKNDSGLSASADAKWDMDEARLTAMGVRLGWKDPKEFKGFALEYRQKWLADNAGNSHHFGATFEYALGRVAARVSGSADMTDSKFTGAKADLLAGYELDKNWMLLGGAGYKGTMNEQNGAFDNAFEARLGVQYKNVAVTAGYQPDQKAWSLGISIPLGRR